MVIDYFNMVGIAMSEFKTHAPAAVNAYAVLVAAVAFKFFQTIRGWYA
jgi:hypothetical protein